jgi:hypothetical protein
MAPGRMKAAMERARIQLDQWYRVEHGRGPEMGDLGERAQTLVDVLQAAYDAWTEDIVPTLGAVVDAQRDLAREVPMLEAQL